MHRAFSFPVTVERSRTKERLEASLTGLCELELRKQRQECLVLGALALGDPLLEDRSRGELACFSSWGQENLTLRRQLVRSLSVFIVLLFFRACFFLFRSSRRTSPHPLCLGRRRRRKSHIVLNYQTVFFSFFTPYNNPLDRHMDSRSGQRLLCRADLYLREEK